MRLKLANTRNPDFICLGTQSNNDTFQIAADLAHKIHAWAPKQAKSFSVLRWTDTDYNHTTTCKQTGYGTAEVAYFSKANEGDANLVSGGWSRICNPERWGFARVGNTIEMHFLGAPAPAVI